MTPHANLAPIPTCHRSDIHDLRLTARIAGGIARALHDNIPSAQYRFMDTMTSGGQTWKL